MFDSHLRNERAMQGRLVADAAFGSRVGNGRLFSVAVWHVQAGDGGEPTID